MNKILLYNFDKNIYNKKYFCYIIAGDEIFFIKRKINLLFKKLLTLDYLKNQIIIIDDNTIWNDIFSKFIIIDFFCKKQIIHLIFLNKKIFFKFKNNIINIIKYIDINNILILEIHDYINLYIEKIIKNFINNKYLVFYIYNKLNGKKLINWIYYRFSKFNLYINKKNCNLLKNLYSKNLMLLNQIIKNIYINKNNQNYLDNVFYLKNSNLITSILEGDIKNSFEIIRQMKKNKQNIFLIFNKLQKTFFLIFKIYRNLKKYPLNIIFKNFLISLSKSYFYKKILKRMNNQKFHLIFKLLLEIEINIKSFIINNYTEKYFWIDLEKLIFLIS
ncbi:hypothetical protein GJU01_01455 [Enterobacteriaceae endosymbiont of Donacia vulgaris]|uniref:DNA polymerase III subunit delta n=1 Tax=Enterobacteriaceae endosymbiont of Donacia vulgaris TaxID=2675789 RepID=UPI001449B128|nr:hypothetical protein [Enterobacteriaceae endosymbiont of Donacia vulgaris]QJC36993.1 hypothetical protein GJU01_01455 [Enterobacteriaceae endosymbiont of Donacia vulgaris]